MQPLIGSVNACTVFTIIVWRAVIQTQHNRNDRDPKFAYKLYKNLFSMSTTLPLFWHLSSTSKQERVDASVKLVGALEEFQFQFIPAGSPAPSSNEGDDEGSKHDVLDALNAQDVSYSIRRLVRGLASPRQCSRLGFAVALSEVRLYFDFLSIVPPQLTLDFPSCCLA
jgi:hypothetical protein